MILKELKDRVNKEKEYFKDKDVIEREMRKAKDYARN